MHSEAVSKGKLLKITTTPYHLKLDKCQSLSLRNQSSDWLCPRGQTLAIRLFLRGKRIPTPVCALARNDIVGKLLIGTPHYFIL